MDLQDEDIDDFLDSNFEAPKLNISSAYYHCLDSLLSQFSFHMVLSNSCQKQLKTGPFNSRTVPKALCQNELEPFLQHSPNPIRHLHLLCGSHEDLQIMSEYPVTIFLPYSSPWRNPRGKINSQSQDWKNFQTTSLGLEENKPAKKKISWKKVYIFYCFFTTPFGRGRTLWNDFLVCFLSILDSLMLFKLDLFDLIYAQGCKS